MTTNPAQKSAGQIRMSKMTASSLHPPPEIRQNDFDPEGGPDGSAQSIEVDADRAEPDKEDSTLEDSEHLRELQKNLGRLEEFAAQAKAENSIHPGPRGGPEGLSALMQEIRLRVASRPA
jgi:hypothetical protein